jgi:hypothetical protein
MNDLPERTRETTAAEARRIAGDLVTRGWRVLALPEQMQDAQDFLRGIRTLLPLDPPIENLRSWDALLDSLRAGLYQLGTQPLGIVWADPEPMRKAAPDDFGLLVEILGDLTLMAGRPGEALPSEILFVLGGEHPRGPTRRLDGVPSRDIREH